MSNERQSENIENKIKKALEGGEHAFNETAWAKMEALLDKEEKKRRPILWLWLLPVLLIGVALIIKFSSDTTSSDTAAAKNNIAENERNTTGKNKQASTEPSSKTININNDESNKKLESTGSTTDKNEITKESVTSPAVKGSFPNDVKSTQLSPRQSKYVAGDDNLNVKTKSSSKSKTNTNTRDNLASSNVDLQPATVYDQKNDEEKTAAPPRAGELLNKEKSANTNSSNSLPTFPASDSAVKEQEAPSTESTNKDQSKNTAASKNNKHKTFAPQFYLLGSLGADAGSVRLLSFKNSTVTPKYGIGIGYQFSRSLSIQTGFYIANKKYAAGAGDYHVKPGSYWDTYKLTSVDAICKVYDIPISIRYDFAANGSVKYYAMAGLSSYLMKKEDYNYYYLRWGMPAEKYYTYTGNRHLFSNLNFSLGIEKKISGNLSLQVEPSVSLPISGVGDGKVKLYSASLIAGIKYLPFKK